MNTLYLRIIFKKILRLQFNNLYTHFVFITPGRQFMIPEKSRIRD